MGLDMYLWRKTFVGAEYEHRKVDAKIKITVAGKPLQINPKMVSEIIERVGYWRKANAIHAWFVREVQGGVDECQEADVSVEKLRELRALCAEVLADKSKADKLLPPQAGFFFGSTAVDEGYVEDLKDTIKIIDALPLDEKSYDVSYVYRSSW
jgi:hypothetical protein